MKAEKFEIKKGKYTKYLTGIIKPIEEGRVVINTIRGETLIFWKEQVLGSLPTDIDMPGEEDEKNSKNV